MKKLMAAASALLLSTACGPADHQETDAGNEQTDELVVPDTYAFESRFVEGESSVSYTGQALRQVLITSLESHIKGYTDRVDNDEYAPVDGEVVSELEFFWDFDAGRDVVPHAVSTTPPALQETFGDFGNDASLKSKIAGNDPTGQHEDWSTALVGFADVTTPEALVLSWFERLEEVVVDRALNGPALDPSGEPIDQAHITPEGLQLQELVGKFLAGALAFSQGADDYLDDDLDGKGLNADNTQAEDGKTFTALEHAWDEGFGYFGAARDFGLFTDEEIAAKGGRADWQRAHDANGDGKTDLTSEYNFGIARYAAQRDLASAEDGKTDFTGKIWEAFVTGRAIIAHADGALTDEEMTQLKAQRDQAVATWEQVLAANAVHYGNALLQDMALAGTEDYSFAKHAGHWSELKGFALAFQFNPRSKLTDEEFVTLHEKLGDAPVLPGQPGFEAYKTAIREARALLMTAFELPAANTGDDNGLGGW